MNFLQLKTDQRCPTVVGKKVPFEPPAICIFPDPRDGFFVNIVPRDIGRHKIVSEKPLFGDLHHARIGCPDRLHRAAKNTGQKENIIRDIMQNPHERRGPDRAILCLNRNHNSIGTGQFVPVIDKGLDIGVVCRQLLEKPGIQTKLRRMQTKPDCERRQHHKHQSLRPEHHIFNLLQHRARPPQTPLSHQSKNQDGCATAIPAVILCCHKCVPSILTHAHSPRTNAILTAPAHENVAVASIKRTRDHR